MSNQVYGNQVAAAPYFPNIKAKDVLDVSILKFVASSGIAPKADLNTDTNVLEGWPAGSLFGLRWDRINGTFVEGPAKDFHPYQSALTQDTYSLYEDNGLGYSDGGTVINALKNCVLEIGVTLCYKKTVADKSTFFVVIIKRGAASTKNEFTVDNQGEGLFTIVRSFDFTLRLDAGAKAHLYIYSEDGASYGTYYEQRSQMTITKLS